MDTCESSCCDGHEEEEELGRSELASFCRCRFRQLNENRRDSFRPNRTQPQATRASMSLNMRSIAAPPLVVGYGSRLCENSDFELSCRNSFSITMDWKRTALPVITERRKGRKQFCAFFARARFYAW